MVTATADRVRIHTPPDAAASIELRLDKNLTYYREHPELIPDRLAELDREWDIERALATMSASLTLAGALMTMLRGKKWLVVPLGVQGFYLQHAIQGWCPPLPLLRRMGFRTQQEIDQERAALEAIQECAACAPCMQPEEVLADDTE